MMATPKPLAEDALKTGEWKIQSRIEITLVDPRKKK